MSEIIWQNTDPRRDCSIYKGVDVIICRRDSDLIGGWEVGLGDVETKHGYHVGIPFKDSPGLYEDDGRVWNDKWFYTRMSGQADSKDWNWKTSDPRWEITKMIILIQDRDDYCFAIVNSDTDYIIETNFPECHNIMAGDDWPDDWKWMAVNLPE